MNLSEKLLHYLLPKHLRENSLHPEYEETYGVVRGQLFGGVVMLFIVALMFWGGVFWAPYFLSNIFLMWACLLFSRANLLQQANVVFSFLLYFIYFPVYLHSGGIYSINLLTLYPMLFANMYTHRKWGIYLAIPASVTVWLLYILTPDSHLVSSVMGSRLYVAIFHTLIIVSVPAIFVTMEKKRNVQIAENKTVQNNTINTLNTEVARRTKELTNMRQTLAADFHDETGNMLSAITRQAALLKLKLAADDDVMNIVNHIISNSNKLYSSSRHFIWNLNNDSDDPQILFNYLTSFAQVFYNQFDVSFSAENTVGSSSGIRLESFAATNLIFIFKEAMNNVVKHAEADEVVLKMSQHDDHLSFSLTDNGTWKERDEGRSHHGLSNMEKRCAQNSFGFTINHIKGIGTRVEIAVPIVSQTVQLEPA